MRMNVFCCCFFVFCLFVFFLFVFLLLLFVCFCFVFCFFVVVVVLLLLFFLSEFKPACIGVTAWFPSCINKYTFLALMFLCTVHFVDTTWFVAWYFLDILCETVFLGYTFWHFEYFSRYIFLHFNVFLYFRGVLVPFLESWRHVPVIIIWSDPLPGPPGSRQWSTKALLRLRWYPDWYVSVSFAYGITRFFFSWRWSVRTLIH